MRRWSVSNGIVRSVVRITLTPLLRTVPTSPMLAGCPVMQGTGRQWNFPTNHPLYIGPLGFLGGMKESLAGYDVIIAIGTGNPFNSLFYEGGSPIPEDCAFVHMDLDSWEMGT